MTGIAAAYPGPTLDSTTLDSTTRASAAAIFFGLLAAGIVYAGWSLHDEVTEASGGTMPVGWLALLLLGALLIALGFEFVNGFHDTANAVATVIYTNSMPAQAAVVWSGCWNFLGVLAASGAVAYGIISLLPVELILQVGTSAGFAMVFALLIAAVIWNLGTWWVGLPASSSHTLIGSIIGVGVANQLLQGEAGTSGVDWSKAIEIAWSLLLSPLFGFAAGALLLLAIWAAIPRPELFEAPKGRAPPPFWTRVVLILTCTGVSFAHGSNDGQKGMGLIMLILIGTVPTAYALNRSMDAGALATFDRMSATAAALIESKARAPARAGDPRPAVTAYVGRRVLAEGTYPALAALTRDVAAQIRAHGTLDKLPADAVGGVRNDLYLVSEAMKFILKDDGSDLGRGEKAMLRAYKGSVDEATRYIPLWVKITVAIALGLGTMVGWKRIVVTVGEKIGKSHLTYAQGAAAETVAATTIGVADVMGLPVSTTHVLSSAVAGTMAANRSGLQMTTVRRLLMAWVLTLPVSVLLAGGLYVLFLAIF